MPDREQRTHGIHAGVVAAVLATFGLVIVAAALAAHALATWWDAPLSGANASEPPLRIEGPRLESAPQYDRDRYYAEKDRLLDRYEWIDREHRIARIPIETAMEVVRMTPAAPAVSSTHGDEGARR
jgi:hypothetical protein